MKNYNEAFNFFRKNGGKGTVVVDNNTLLLKGKSEFTLSFHNMPVVKYHRYGKVTLLEDDCGTTELRNIFNQHTPDGVNVVQRKFQFYVEFFGVTLPFVEGEITLDVNKKEVHYANTNLGV